jgi:hypothetical protein
VLVPGVFANANGTALFGYARWLNSRETDPPETFPSGVWRESGLYIVARRPGISQWGHFAVSNSAARLWGCLPEPLAGDRQSVRAGKWLSFSYSEA